MSQPVGLPWRPGPLSWGAALAFVAVWILFALVDAGSPHPNVDISSTGRALSAHGGIRLKINAERRGPVVQSCRDACDDLRFLTESGDNVFLARAVDGQGHDIVDGGSYVTNGIPTRIRLVEGGARLQITVE